MSNTRITKLERLPSPNKVAELCGEVNLSFVEESRKTIESILNKTDEQNRMLCIVGPCSIHNYEQAIEYAKKLKEFRESANASNFFIVMRVYFEKPRTTVGWKGFIYDPHLDETNDIEYGLINARKLLIELTNMKIPVGVEFLDTITPQYLADLVSWGAIGARTVESQIHRQLASGLSMPVGFKNCTDGNVKKALDGIKSASIGHSFLGINGDGQASLVDTTGNKYSHLILRGGAKETNYDFKQVSEVAKEMKESCIHNRLIIDCSHGNSCKEFSRQVLVATYVRSMFLTSELPIAGIMIESNLKEGNQPLTKELKYGVSITDSCLGWDDTAFLLKTLNNVEIIDGQYQTLEKMKYYLDLACNDVLPDFSAYIPLKSNYIVQDRLINVFTKSDVKLNIVMTLYLALHESMGKSEVLKTIITGKHEEFKKKRGSITWDRLIFDLHKF